MTLLGGSYRANKQASALNRLDAGKIEYIPRVIGYASNRKAALDMERLLVYGNPGGKPPGNVFP